MKPAAVFLTGASSGIGEALAVRYAGQGARLGLTGFSPPSGGYYLWCPLPDGFDDMDLTRRAAAAGIFMAPSSIFTLDRVGYRPAIRVNVAYADDPRFLAFMRGELA